MSKPFPYWFRLSLVTSLAVLLTFNPVYAGRFFNKRKSAQDNCCPQECYQQQSSCCPPVACGADAGLIVLNTIPNIPECGCEIPMASSMAPAGPIHKAPVESSPSTTSKAPSPPASSQASPPTTKEAPKADVAPPSVEQPQAEMPKAEIPQASVFGNDKPTVEEPKPTVNDPFGSDATPPTPAKPADDLFGAEPKVEPKVEAKAADADLFGAPTPEPAQPKATEPDPNLQPPVADPFGNPGEAAPKPNMKGDDLFGAPTDPPAPKVEAKPAADDLFGGSPAAPQATPQADPFGTPAVEQTPAAKVAAPADDLFGAPKAVQAAPADDLFGAPNAPVPEKAPAPEKPAPTKEAADDLFGTPAPTPAPAKAAADDLFGTPASTDSKPADDLFGNPTEVKPVASDDTFGKPEKQEASPSAPAVLEDLFSATGPVSTEMPTDDAKPQEPGSDSKKLKSNIDDLFSSNDSTFNGADNRVWGDNTGNFQVKARLAMIYPDRIKLQKENGKFTTVPMRRLSDSDKLYVQWVAASLTKSSKLRYVQSPAEKIEQETE